jgi:inorganic pyrophosphatase
LFADINDLPPAWVTEIEHFFISYNSVQGREFRVIEHGGPEEAEAALATAERRHKRQNKSKL